VRASVRRLPGGSQARRIRGIIGQRRCRNCGGQYGQMMKIVFVFLVLAIVGLAGYSWITLHWSYSTGERAGFVQKLSNKGWLCKTWEGEMAMVTMPGTVSEKFYFTVPDAAVAARINASLGKRVALHYEQHKWIPNSCFGETEYFVTGMQATE
jgi:hypothetical protein